METDLFGKIVPQHNQAEQSIIGSMLIDSRCIADVIGAVKSDEFYNKINKDIFDTIFTMFTFGEPIDPVTVLNKMKDRGVYTDNAEEYIAEVIRITPTAANVLEYAKIVKDKALMRRLGEAADEINQHVYGSDGDADSVLELAEKKVFELRQGRVVGGLRRISDVLERVFDNISEVSKNGGQVPGLSTGFPDIDSKILGLNKSDFIIIAARPGVGKTSIALNMALHVGLVLKQKVAFFSLEMSREQLVTRLLSKSALVPSKNLLTGQLSEAQWKSIGETANLMYKSDILIDDTPSLTVADMNAACRRIDNLGLVVIDYLQLMSSAGGGKSGETRTQIVSDISRMMKVMAKELNVPVICLSQLNRASESRQDKRPMLSDLRESGAIEQDADVVIGLYRESSFNNEAQDPNAAEAIILKNRKGETGTAYLRWIPEYTSFESSTVRDEEY